MGTLNWKGDKNHCEARASREVGGTYQIMHLYGDLTWRGDYETYYTVKYRGHGCRHWRDRDIEYPRGKPGTLAEAKRMAEEDHEQRQREAAAKAAALKS